MKETILTAYIYVATDITIVTLSVTKVRIFARFCDPCLRKKYRTDLNIHCRHGSI